MNVNKIDPKSIPVFHGVLENWVQSGPVVYGLIFNDRKGRFSDGTSIHTSGIDRVEGVLLYTRNSVYVLGKPATT